MVEVFVEQPLALPGSAKNPAYRRHRISRPMRIDAQIKKETCKSLDIIKVDGVGPVDEKPSID